MCLKATQPYGLVKGDAGRIAARAAGHTPNILQYTVIFKA